MCSPRLPVPSMAKGLRNKYLRGTNDGGPAVIGRFTLGLLIGDKYPPCRLALDFLFALGLARAGHSTGPCIQEPAHLLSHRHKHISRCYTDVDLDHARATAAHRAYADYVTGGSRCDYHSSLHWQETHLAVVLADVSIPSRLQAPTPATVRAHDGGVPSVDKRRFDKQDIWSLWGTMKQYADLTADFLPAFLVPSSSSPPEPTPASTCLSWPCCCS